MKTSNITKSALALALGLCASGAWAAKVTTVSETFESYNVGTGISGLATSNVTWTAGSDDSSSVIAGKKLEIDTGADAVTAAITDATGFNAAYGESVKPTFTATVSFTPATTAPTIDDTNNDLKFALYALAGATTNLYVIGQGGTPVDTEITLADTSEKALIVTFEANNQFTVKYGNSAVKGPYTFKNGSGIAKLELSGNGTVDNIEFAYDNPTWEDLLGNTIATDTYGIDSLAELKNFQQGVAKGLPTVGKTFKLTADVALDAAWPGIGLQNGKDLVDEQAFVDGAFSGIFDGQNHTISGFKMIGKGDNPEGLDYCGFFNSINGATIRNLKIRYDGALFAEDTTASTKESGATFVGVAMASTLQNLTSLPKDAQTAEVSCSKGFGGIVGYLATNSVGAATVVNSCTNNVNLKSLANNKVGGIVMISQRAGCSIINCQNNGTATTTSGEHGGILGYTDGITITDCENTANVKMFYHHGGTVTLTGTNKGNATVQSYTGNDTPGLNFAIVDGDVATFVADSPLAAGNTYKVMHAATATYKFTAAGTIAFDTALVTPTWAVTADEGLSLSDATSGTVKTYTAIVPAETYGTTEGTDTAIDIKSGDGSASHTLTTTEASYLNELVQEKGGTAADQDDIEAAIAQLTEKEFTDAVLLNQDVTDTTNAGSYKFDITKISKNSSGVTVTVTLTRDGTPRGGIKGQLVLQTSETPNGTYADAAAADINIENFKFDTGVTTATANVVFTGSYKFFKVVIR